jgi:hypothetical protein
MRLRLVAAAAGAALIVAALLTFSLSSRPVVAGHSAVEPVRTAVYLATGSRQCQTVSRLPAGADRLQLRVNHVTGGARVLRVEISDRRGPIAAADVKPAAEGEAVVRLRPRTREAHPATLCFSNPSRGQINLGGDAKRAPAGPKGKFQKPLVASAVFLRPGSSSWFAQRNLIAERYANSQTGVTGGWSLWIAGLLAVAAILIGLWAVLALPERRP